MQTNSPQSCARDRAAAWLGRARAGAIRRAASVVALLLLAASALGQDAAHPLRPPDRSSPRAALTTFLEACDALATYVASDYLPAPTQAKFQHAVALGERAILGLDQSDVPPATRMKSGRAAALALYEVLSRVPLPAPETVPGPAHPALPSRWVVPDTEIALVRVETGPRSGEYLFSAGTVARAEDFYERVRALPYLRPVPIQDLHETVATGGGWMIPLEWTRAMPGVLRAPVAGQSVWKWIGLVLVLAVTALFLRLVHRVSRTGGARHPFVVEAARLAMPAAVLVATPAAAYVVLAQLNFVGGAAAVVEFGTAAAMFVAGAWLAVRLGPVAAEAILVSPRIVPESIDAQLVRMGTRLLGLLAGITLLAVGADRLGMPVYGVIAGLGVGGLAIALAAQPTIENLIGGLNLFADKPLRVGDVCRYGTDVGTVESIGIRSTRIRGADRTLTTIPNAVLARMPIVNLTRRDRIPIRAVIGLRCETRSAQMRQVLDALGEALRSHPRVDPASARARFAGFGASSLDIELSADVLTTNAGEFAEVREQVLLRVMEAVESSGTSLAFPSQTIYLGRDREPGAGVS